MNSKGQALVEAIGSSLVAIIAIGALLFLFLLIFVKMLCHRILYEAMICDQLVPKAMDCRWKADKGLRSIRMGSRLLFFQMRSTKDDVKAEALFLLPMNYKLRIEDSIQLPLIK